MSRKGVSAEEKAIRVLAWFHEENDFFQLKEVEPKVSKAKGIPQQSVADVVQALVDDDLVNKDKIGSSYYFWSFRGAIEAQKERELRKVESAYKTASEQNASLKAQLAQMAMSDSDLARRNELKQERDRLLKTSKSLAAEVQRYASNDPALFKAKEKAIEVAREAALRWTDNVTILRSQFIARTGLSSKEFNQHFEIPDDFEDLV